MKEQSIFKILHHYRNTNQIINDRSNKYFRHHKKITDFRTLIEVGQDETSKAYLNPHTHVVMIINSDGYIDHILYLYDRKLKFFDSKGLEEKTKKVLDNYYKSTKNDFIESLYANGFISYTIYQKLKKECLK